MQLKMKAASY